MIPGEVIPLAGEIALNEDRKSTTLMVANTGDRPIQVGSHYHFGEANSALEFDRDIALGMRLDIAAGTAAAISRRMPSAISRSNSRALFASPKW